MYLSYNEFVKFMRAKLRETQQEFDEGMVQDIF